MNKNLYVVILAGGSGTRFWPLSRQSNPKQFLKIVGKRSLLQETIHRLRSEVKADHIFIAAGAAYHKQIKKQISIPASNYLLEPSGKNTAPAICWAASRIHSRNKNAVMAVLPSDHLIQDPKEFLKVLGQATRLAAKDYLVTMGIVPTRPETGYGYLKTERKGGVLRVAQFTEKPSRKKAEKFLKTKKYLWNSGMFIWKTSVILEAFKTYQPKIYGFLKDKNSPAHVRKVWGRMPSISVDYAILEKASRVAAVPAQRIGWSDLGSWEALADVLQGDTKKNIAHNDVLSLNCKDTLVWGDKKLIAAVGLDNVVIVDTPDALLVCRKDLSQDVRDVISALKKKKRNTYI